MSSTSQYTDFSDLYTGLIEATRSESTDTATLTQAKRYINVALQDMHLGFDYKFLWAERNAVLISQPEYTTGTLSVTQGSTTITGSGTTWNTNNNFGVANMRAGGKIRINSGQEVFEITAVASDTSATIGHRFTQDDVSGVSYTYFEDEYALASDFLRPIDQQIFSTDMPIDLIDRNYFRRRFVRNFIPGKPSVACILDKPFNGSTAPVRKIRFHKPPDKAYSIPYSYVTENLVVQADGTAASVLSNDTDEPIVPLRYRHAILFWALYHWYRDKRDDDRSQEAKAEYNDIMVRTLSDVDLGSRRMRLRPGLAAYRAKSRYPYRGMRNRRYSVNNQFDRFEN